jgi:hypothetical protein
MAKPTMQPPQMGITTSAVSRASAELEKMKSSLKGWLKYRQLNDDVLAGRAKTKIPPGLAQRIVAKTRDVSAEQDLANKLHALLSELMPGANLPDPDLGSDRNVAVQLAQIALAGGKTSQTSLSGILTASSTSHP